MSANKVHMQLGTNVLNVKPSDVALCGMFFPTQVTSERAKVTCKKCNRRLKTQDRLVEVSRHSAAYRYERFESESRV